MLFINSTLVLFVLTWSMTSFPIHIHCLGNRTWSINLYHHPRLAPIFAHPRLLQGCFERRRQRQAHSRHRGACHRGFHRVYTAGTFDGARSYNFGSPYLVGGFNSLEKYLSNQVISPGRGEKKKLKPPPSYIFRWNSGGNDDSAISRPLRQPVVLLWLSSQRAIFSSVVRRDHIHPALATNKDQASHIRWHRNGSHEKPGRDLPPTLWRLPDPSWQRLSHSKKFCWNQSISGSYWRFVFLHRTKWKTKTPKWVLLHFSKLLASLRPNLSFVG